MFVTVVQRQQIRRAGFLSILFLLAFVASLARTRILAATPRDPEEQPLTRAEILEDRVALTFDVTWGEEELAKIVSILDQNQVQATFFVGGTFLSLRGDTVKRLAAGQHEIATLGQKIIDLSGLPEHEVTTNLLASQSALAKVLGGPVRYFRPPRGPATPSIIRGALAAGLKTVTFSLNSKDQSGLSAEAIARRVVGKARRGDVILLSASDWSPETSKALPQIIQGLQDKGFQLVRLSELVPDDELSP